MVSIDRVWRRPGRRSLFGIAAAGIAWASRGQAQSGAPAQQPVSELYAALQSEMRSGQAFQARFNQLAPVIDRVFDLNTILQVSVGLRWASMDEAARRELSSVFRAFTIASYTANFEKDGGERFEVLPQVRPSGSDVIVQSKLTPAGGDPVQINYLMRGGAGGWRIVDVLLNGSISRVAVQRSDFRSLLASGSPVPLIDSLKQKIVTLSGGTMRL